eukprot:scaffold267491_cov17-Tisochrysis_lutea.AAC.1
MYDAATCIEEGGQSTLSFPSCTREYLFVTMFGGNCASMQIWAIPPSSGICKGQGGMQISSLITFADAKFWLRSSIEAVGLPSRNVGFYLSSQT